MTIDSRYLAPPTFTSVAQAAAIALQQDAQTSRENARAQRQDAQQREVDHLKRAAAELHQMADKAMTSGIWQGIFGGIGAACQVAGAFKTDKLWDGLLKGGMRAADTVGKIDPAQISSKYDAAQRADCETAAKVASNQAQNAGDIEQQARKREQKADEIRQQLMRIEHETRKAALGQR